MEGAVREVRPNAGAGFARASGKMMPDRWFDHANYAGMQTAIRQIEERMREISKAAKDKITEIVRRWRNEQAARAGGKGVELG
jgi:hypothetical protein